MTKAKVSFIANISIQIQESWEGVISITIYSQWEPISDCRAEREEPIHGSREKKKMAAEGALGPTWGATQGRVLWCFFGGWKQGDFYCGWCIARVTTPSGVQTLSLCQALSAERYTVAVYAPTHTHIFRATASPLFMCVNVKEYKWINESTYYVFPDFTVKSYSLFYLYIWKAFLLFHVYFGGDFNALSSVSERVLCVLA